MRPLRSHRFNRGGKTDDDRALCAARKIQERISRGESAILCRCDTPASRRSSRIYIPVSRVIYFRVSVLGKSAAGPHLLILFVAIDSTRDSRLNRESNGETA